MIRFLNPGFAWALAAPALVLALYMLRRKHLPRQVPSVFLWQRSLRDQTANRPLRRLVKSLLMILQMLAALALALALMRPAVSGEKAGRTVLIFDVSGSMQAETGGRTRLEIGKEKALQLIRTLPAEEEISILTAGEEAECLALAVRRDEAEKAVAGISCQRGSADLDRALSLADAIARDGDSEPGAETVIYTDNLRRASLSLRTGALSLSIIGCGKGAENRAVYSLEAEGGQAFARVANYGEACAVTLVCEADGVLCDAREAEIPAGGTAGVSFSIPETASRVRVSLRETDALRADNTAEAAVRRAKQRKVAVTMDSVFLESALRIRPDLTVVRAETEALAGTEADLYLLGNCPLIVTTALPEAGYDPEAKSFGSFTWGEPENPGEDSPSPAVSDSPLTGGVTMKNIFFRSYLPITGGRAAVSLGTKTVIAYGQETAVLGFDLHDSNLPLKYDFPLLIQNTLDWLLPEQEQDAEATEPLMPMGESNVLVVTPDDVAEGRELRTDTGRELTGILLAVFLLLMLAEMGVSRYVG